MAFFSGGGITTGDLSIGAVEIKDATTDTRAVVGANGLHVDVQAMALPTGAATEATLAALDAKVTACDTTSLATEATVGSIKTSVELIDDAVYTGGSGTPSKGVLMMGTDGTNPQALKVNSDGELAVNLETADIEIGAVEIKNSTDDTRATVGANGLYVDVQASALPTGAATETTLAALETKVTACDTTSLATEATLATLASAGMVTVAYDYVGVAWTVGTFTEVFTFKTGGSSGTTVATVTVIYTDATKAQLVSVTKT